MFRLVYYSDIFQFPNDIEKSLNMNNIDFYLGISG